MSLSAGLPEPFPAQGSVLRSPTSLQAMRKHVILGQAPSPTSAGSACRRLTVPSSLTLAGQPASAQPHHGCMTGSRVPAHAGPVHHHHTPRVQNGFRQLALRLRVPMQDRVPARCGTGAFRSKARRSPLSQEVLCRVPLVLPSRTSRSLTGTVACAQAVRWPQFRPGRHCPPLSTPASPSLSVADARDL